MKSLFPKGARSIFMTSEPGGGGGGGGGGGTHVNGGARL